MPDNNTTWLAAHLYYAEPWETFLTEAVLPFANQMREEQLAGQFFFIRYWENGPHIRLRFHGESSLLERVVKYKLLSHFRSYFQQHPSQRPEPAWLAQLPEDQVWYPNNSVQFIPYEPEVDRYGGARGITVAEQLFFSSSQVILDAIAQSPEWNYQRALGVGVQLHLAMLYQLGLSREEAGEYFQLVFRHWLPRAYYHPGEKVGTEALQQRQDEVLKAFARSYDRQKLQIINIISTLWEGLEQGVAFNQPWFQQWINDMRQIKKQIDQAQREQRLVPPSHHSFDSSLSVPDDHRILWTIYESYVHMTNNRLGILNRDEGYLGYLLIRALRELQLQPT
ncbi:MAG: thiopeptide-type bacteriocin biosynthesis protein [Bacteroidota bacterium]